jgi:hypothetical protein
MGQLQARIIPLMPNAIRPLEIANMRQFHGNIQISYRKSQQVFGNYLFQKGNINIKNKNKTYKEQLNGHGAITFKSGKILWLSTLQSAQKNSIEVIQFNSQLKKNNKGTTQWNLTSGFKQQEIWRIYGPQLQQLLKSKNILGRSINYFTSTINFQEVVCLRLRGQQLINCQIPFTISSPETKAVGLNQPDLNSLPSLDGA